MTNKEILKYRLVWLGCAMIWIVLYHLSFNYKNPLIDACLDIGYGGVDICIFASGAGCYYSLSSNSDLGVFIKRRIKRIAPTYLCFIVLWLVYRFILRGVSIPMIIGNIFAVRHLTGHDQAFNWYISGIILCYLLAPYMKVLIDRSSRTKQILFGGFLLLLSVAFWDSRTLIIIVTRFPLFYMGMLFARDSKNNVAITARTAMVLLTAVLSGLALLLYVNVFHPDLLWNKGLFWYPFIMIVPGVCVLISWISKLCECNRITNMVKKCLEKIGEYSFEIYLLHIPLVEVGKDIISRYGWDQYQVVIWFVALVALIVGCIVLKRVAEFTSRRLFTDGTH